MANPAIDYLARTFDVIRQRGLDLVKLRLNEYEYNDFIRAGVGPAVIDVLAWFHEQNAHYYDRRRINSLLILADTVESMRILTRAQGYTMRPATSASVALQASPTPPQPVPITIRAGTQVVVDRVTFEVVEAFTIPAGAATFPDGTTDDLLVMSEGVTVRETFFSDGSGFQTFDLGQPNIIDDSLTINVLDEAWEEVESLVFVEGDQLGRDSFSGDGSDNQEFTLSLLNAVANLEDEDGVIVLVTPFGGTQADAQRWQQVAVLTGGPREFVMVQDPDGVTRIQFGTTAAGAAPMSGDSIEVLYLISGAQKRYQLILDQENRGKILFGDGVFGVIPPNGAQIDVVYRVGGGVRGNVPAGAIDVTVQGYKPSGTPTPVRIRNSEPGSGGEPAETVDHARFFAPRFAKSNERAVTKAGFTALAATYVDPVFGAPSHANAFLKQRSPELNTVCVAVWGRDQNGRLSTAGTPLKLGIKRFLDTKRTITTVVEMKDGQIVLMDMDLLIELESGAIRQTVFDAVLTSIQRFFDSAFVLPGIDLSISNLYAAIEDTEGVARAEIVDLVGSRLAQLTLGEGDGVLAEFSGNFVLEEGTTVVVNSIAVTDSVQQVVDDGDGGFVGDVDESGTNTADYTNGEFTTTFVSPPTVGRVITAEAKLQVFFDTTENLGGSDGSVQEIDGATIYFPILKRGPRGAWSGDQVRVIDGFRVGSSAQYIGALPVGIMPGTLTIVEPVSAQTITDNGAGVLLQGATPVGTVGYSTGAINLTFLVNPAVSAVVTASWSTRTVDILLPSEFLPLVPGRVFFWGGYSVDGAQPGSAELTAQDDGEGNMVGDVQAGGLINYDSGRVTFEWNTDPPPFSVGGYPLQRFGYLRTAPDGVTRTFAFDVFSAPGGAGAPVDLTSSGYGGEGRTRFQFSDLSTAGVTFEDAYDNWQGQIHGDSINREGSNVILYALSGINATANGTVTFDVPPPVGAPQDFDVWVTNVATFMYSGWVFRVKSPGGPGLDKFLFADNNGRLWGQAANAFPLNRLDHLRGRYVAQLAGSPIAAGRDLVLTYDALTGVPPARDIPLNGEQIASLGRVNMTEKPPETFVTGE
jgi:hypothetical protein